MSATVFGFLRVSGTFNRGKSKYAQCTCVCGTKKTVRLDHLRAGKILSCGCYARQKLIQRNTTHGLRRCPEYGSWAGMNRRCHLPTDHLFKWYGARGITVCREWRGKGGFEKFLAHIGRKPRGRYSVDRIDNNRGYEPGNVRWATQKEQCRNKRTTKTVSFRGKVKPLIAWCEELGLRYQAIHHRITKLHWSVEEALSTPMQQQARRAS